MSRDAKTLRWFKHSPDAGEPDCICSYCGERIEESPEEEDDLPNDYEGEPIRMWTNDGKPGSLEARFHPRCFNECLELGIVTMPK